MMKNGQPLEKSSIALSVARLIQSLQTPRSAPSTERVATSPPPTLHAFVIDGWHVLEPGRPFVDNWHVEAICEHLEAVSRGEIQNLLINIPPRHTKSLLVSVFWPCWEWGPLRRPDLRYINSSYAGHLSIRDNLKSRTLIQSGWYQARWGSVFTLRDDQNTKVKFENDHHGFRLASFVGGGTGEGGDRIICDDPNNVTEVESDTIRNRTNEWWDLQMYNRVTNVKAAARVMIMQRTHHERPLRPRARDRRLDPPEAADPLREHAPLHHRLREWDEDLVGPPARRTGSSSTRRSGTRTPSTRRRSG